MAKINVENGIINPMGTAVWLVDNTSLTVDQIAKFCGINSLEVKNILDGQSKIPSSNPITNFQLTREEIELCQNDKNRYLTRIPDPMKDLGIKQKKQVKYKTMAHRRVIPEAALYIVAVHPKLSDSEVAKLIGSTRSTVEKIRHGTYKGIAGLVPKDPVLVGLCTTKELENLVNNAK